MSILSYGIAVIGVGEYAETQVIPALKQSSFCNLKAIVINNDKDKGEVAGKYNLKPSQVYYYEELNDLKENQEIQVVYIIVPNKLHREYCEKIAACGKHILCEKPMAVSVQDCSLMIEACRRNNVRLFVGYRLYFDVHHQAVINICKQNKYGSILEIISHNGFVLTDNKDWRLDKDMAGGGCMMDLGIYIVNECRQLFNRKPVSVMAKVTEHRPDMFKEVEECIEWQMHYGDDIKVKGCCSYDDAASDLYIRFESAELRMTNAYKYECISITINNELLQLEELDHKSAMLDHMAECLAENKISRIEPEEGVQDMEVIEAIYKSIRSGGQEPVE